VSVKFHSGVRRRALVCRQVRGGDAVDGCSCLLCRLDHSEQKNVMRVEQPGPVRTEGRSRGCNARSDTKSVRTRTGCCQGTCPAPK
jgi:hypothetical protein